MDEVGKILPTVFKTHVYRGDPTVVEILAPLWPRVVGKAMARQSRPAAFSRGTLTLATESESWCLQLERMGEEIRAEINAFLGSSVVKRLRIRQVIALDSAKAAAISADLARPEKGSRERSDRAASPKSGLARLADHAFQKRLAHSFRKAD